MTNTAQDFKPGQRVRFTLNNLGALAISPEHGRPFFIERHYGTEDEGVVIDRELPDGWLAVLPDEREDDGIYVPVHPDMIESA